MTLRFNKLFYPLWAVEKTVQEFSRLADAEISSGVHHHNVVLKKKSEVSEKELEGEFSNYCLGLSRKEVRPHDFWIYTYRER